MNADDFLLALARARPRTLRELEALSGPLGFDLDGKEFFGGYRPAFGSGDRGPLSKALASASVGLDYFRVPGDDAALRELRLCVRAKFRRAEKLLEREYGPPETTEIEGQEALRFGELCIRPHERDILLDWTAPAARTSRLDDAARTSPFDEAARARFLAALPPALASVTSPPQLRDAVTPPPAAGLTMSVQPSRRWVGPGVNDHEPVLLVSFAVVPPMDAVALADSWGIERPVGVSGDVHQHSWDMLVAGEMPEAPAGRPALAAEPLRAGAYRLRATLAARPPGPLPELSAGASPAYELRDRGGQVVRIEVRKE